MKCDTSAAVESSYRKYYGKLFSALFSQFGAGYVSEIEDAIQNAFYKSLNWKPNRLPHNKEKWLFVVARNDVLNHLKREKRLKFEAQPAASAEPDSVTEDLRLKTVLFLSSAKSVSSQVKVIFILKNIFGLHVKEVSACTLLSQGAIYKSISRAKKDFRQMAKDTAFDSIFEQVSEAEISIVEEVFYAVFNIGFDSFSDKNETIVNDDLCLEALALAKNLSEKFERTTTRNLLALFCFHLARIPAKVRDNRIISFFEQDKSHWSTEFIRLGFHYLNKPPILNKYYVEALIASRHMTATKSDIKHWNEIVDLYQMMLSLSNSPVMKLNLCYCLNRAQRTEEARALLETVENELPREHIYLSLVKAHLFTNNEHQESRKIIHQVLKNINQKIRREYILDNMLSDL